MAPCLFLYAYSLRAILALERGQKESIKQALNSAFSIDRVYGAYVYGTHGEKVAVTGAKEPGVQSRELTHLSAEGDQRGQYDKFDGKAQ